MQAETSAQTLVNTLAKRVNMAAGREEADICLTHVNLVDVYSGQIRENMTIRMGDGVFVGFGPGPAKETVDGGGRFLLPGLVDSHVHIESSMLTPAQFARLVLPLGTTTVMADPHEIANVLGVTGLQYMLENSRNLPLDIRIMLPSCVPATPFEHAGAVLTAEDLAPLMGESHVGGLGEMMNFPGVIQADAHVLAKIALAICHNKPVDGHAPGIAHNMGLQALDAYRVAGILTDHECDTVEEMQERIERGMYCLIRQGSAARNLPTLMQGVTPLNAHYCLLCTDDRHPGDILEHGHIAYLLRLAVENGADPVLAVRMATLNPAQCFGLRTKGGIAPGQDADCLLVDDLRSFCVHSVYAKGQKVAENGRLCVDIQAPTPKEVTGAVRPAPLTPQALALALPTGRARVIGVRLHNVVSEPLERTIRTTNGFFDPSLNPGITRVAVIERHKGTGHVGLGLVEGYTAPGKMLGGVIATTVSHDSHNIVVAGDNEAEILLAVEDLIAMGGGITLVKNGAVLDHLPLPVAGLMSDKSAEEVHTAISRLLATAHAEFGFMEDAEPFMTLSFLALAVIPTYKITDQGLFDVRSFQFVPVSIENSHSNP